MFLDLHRGPVPAVIQQMMMGRYNFIDVDGRGNFHIESHDMDDVQNSKCICMCVYIYRCIYIYLYSLSDYPVFVF